MLIHCLRLFFCLSIIRNSCILKYIFKLKSCLTVPLIIRSIWTFHLNSLSYFDSPFKVPRSICAFHFIPLSLSQLRCSSPNIATLILQTKRKTRENSSLAKKSANVYHCLYSSIEQLQVALWTCMFIRLGLNNEKSGLSTSENWTLAAEEGVKHTNRSAIEARIWAVWFLKLKE